MFCLVGAAVFTAWVAWLTTRFRYRITDRAMEVTLFRVCVRRIDLRDIQSISKRYPRWGENWWNTSRPFRRILVIRRGSGWFRHFVITPLHRYEFKAQLERAIERLEARTPREAGGWEGERRQTPVA